MAVPFILVFFLVSPSVHGHRHNCPKSFNCGKIGQLHFPFYNITDRRCGLLPVNCGKNGTAKLQWGNWSVEVEEVLGNAIKIRDNCRSDFISLKSCDVFNYLPFFSSSSMSTTTFPNIALVKCENRSDPKLNKRTQDRFHKYRSYEKCPGYTFYYSSDPNQQLPSPGSGLPCVEVIVPAAVPSKWNGKARDLFSLFASEYYVGFSVSNKCNKCRLKGGQCTSLAFGEFHCIIEGGCIFAFLNVQGRRNLKLILGTVIPGFFILLVLFLGSGKRWSYISSHVFSRNSADFSKADLEGGSIYFGVPVFSYKELEEATNNFDPSKELGDGGFGTVYHGKLKDGREAAVKRFYEHNYKRVTQFMNEIEILNRLRHRNLVSLYGCTSRQSHGLLLVYEYIPNGTVADHLHGCHAKEGWTPGYVDPEYHQCFQLTDKSDVYSFGVVLIELISSMPAVDISRHRHEISLANLAMNRIQNRAFNELIDPWLGFESDPEVERMTTSWRRWHSGAYSQKRNEANDG
ncbi:unnamed protein product, partial [Thlaspi arvense]